MKKSITLRILIIILSVFILFTIVQAKSNKDNDAKVNVNNGFLGNINELKEISDVMDLLQVYSDVEKDVTKEMLVEGAIKGMLKELGDPHSVFLTKKIMDSFEEDLNGEYSGVGMVVTKKENYLAVVSPIEDTPAFRAGMQPHDKIIAIEEESTFDLTLTECVTRLKGKAGTDVGITVYREKTDKTFDVTLTRAKIEIKYVKSKMLDNEIGYIRLTQFGGDSAEDIRKEIDTLKSEGMKALVFDLRNNPGGELSEAIEIASIFVDESPIVSVKYKAGREEIHKAKGDAYKDFPLVVLVNEGSASASEIVSGAIKDHKRGILIGEKTYGKGSVQSVYPFYESGGAIKLTVARYYRPSGAIVHGKGIEPNIVVKEDEDGRFFEGFVMNVVDEENEESETKEEDVLNSEEEKIENKDSEEEVEKEKQRPDYQLQTAVNVLKGILLTNKEH